MLSSSKGRNLLISTSCEFGAAEIPQELWKCIKEGLSHQIWTGFLWSASSVSERFYQSYDFYLVVRKQMQKETWYLFQSAGLPGSTEIYRSDRAKKNISLGQTVDWHLLSSVQKKRTVDFLGSI